MIRILILGGYGVFGGRLARLLSAEPGFEIIVAGRHRQAAESFCAEFGSSSSASKLVPEQIDHLDALPQRLAAGDIQIVANCVGPYQHLDYAVAEAAIAAGADYLDLADGRAFVTSFARLDAAARAKGVTAITGASTLPAVSSAVVDHLQKTMPTVDSIEMAIAPGFKMHRGVAVVRAILSYTGKPIRVLCDGRWTRRHGWQGLKRRRLVVGTRDTGARWLAVCDVPDLELFPERYTGVRSVAFRAGLELAPLHFGLWAASWLVRARLIPSLEPLARAMKWTADRFQAFGSDRGGMFVDVSGRDKRGQPLTRHWTLIADQGHGPWIPVLPAVVVATKLRDRKIGRTGAFACMGVVSLSEFENQIAAFDIETAITETHV